MPMPKRLFACLLTALLGLGLAGCDGGSSPAVLSAFPQSPHPHVPLLDASGNQLTADATTPYSPRATCGACHDYDHITEAYHFQQGRTDSAGNLVMADDFFGDGRTWLKSAGMYGKW